MPSALDTSHFDYTVRPEDDLFRHVNGTWLANTTIDADKTGAGVFIELRDQSEQRVREIVTGLTSMDTTSEEGKIAALFASFINSERAEDLGAEPLAPLLSRIDAITDTEGLSRYLGYCLRHQIGTLIAAGDDADPGDPTQYVLFFSQAGLGLPDEEYYREDQHALSRENYVAYLARLLELVGHQSPVESAHRVMELETLIAQQHWDKVRTRDLRQMYNPMTYDELAESAPGIDWTAMAQGGEFPTEALHRLVVSQPSFFTGVSSLLVDTEIDRWKDWAKLRTISSLAPYLSSEFVQARFEFYDQHLGGAEKIRERWKRGIAFTESAMGEAIGKLYVAQHFPESSKARMNQLVANLLEAYRESISGLEWMTETTRTEALDKLSKFTSKIAYPDTWRDYSKLQVSRDDLVGNRLAVASFETDYSLSRVSQPVDPHEWLMFPQTVNAYYHPLRNEIVFPAAILQPPFFNAQADDAVNYAAIGAVIGHEIGHGFDDKGSTCDGEGRLRNWWTDTDREAFEARTAALVGQYNALSPEDADGQMVNGELTLGENIGDLGGLGIAWKAWLIAGGKPDGEPIDAMSPAERFFFSWAAAWRGKFRPATVKLRLSSDVHSPNEFRANQVVRNLDAFHDTFHTTPSDALWLAPEDRVTIW